MGDYEAKEHYRNAAIAEIYHRQFESPLGLSNFRSKLLGEKETRTFSALLSLAPCSGRVLDIACGTGRYTELLTQRGYQVGGVDISNEMLAIADRRITQRENLLFLKQADAQHLPFENKQFDGVICMRLYHRIPKENRLEMLKQAKRVSKHWGILFFGMSTSWLNLRRKLRSKLIPGRHSNPYPVAFKELQNELDSVGFKLVDYKWIFPYVAEGLIIFVWQSDR